MSALLKRIGIIAGIAFSIFILVPFIYAVVRVVLVAWEMIIKGV